MILCHLRLGCVTSVPINVCASMCFIAYCLKMFCFVLFSKKESLHIYDSIMQEAMGKMRCI